jgi:hypothetical protein
MFVPKVCPIKTTSVSYSVSSVSRRGGAPVSLSLWESRRESSSKAREIPVFVVFIVIKARDSHPDYLLTLLTITISIHPIGKDYTVFRGGLKKNPSL